LKHTPSIQTLVGEVISQVWFSDYSICYLELGILKAGRILPNGRIGTPSGEFTVFLGYDWKAQVNGFDKSRLDFHTNDVERASLVASLQGAAIRTIELRTSDSEIEICLSTGMTILTVSNEDDDPSWSIRFDKQFQGHLCIEDHKLEFKC